MLSISDRCVLAVVSGFPLIAFGYWERWLIDIIGCELGPEIMSTERNTEAGRCDELLTAFNSGFVRNNLRDRKYIKV